MNKTSRVVGGVALLAFGIGWVLVLTGLVNIKLDGWWTFLIIIPCLVALFSSKHKNGPLIGLGVGVLLLLATLGIVNWDDFWKYIICLVAVVWGISLIFARKSGIYTKHADPHTVNELKKFDQDGRQVHQISVSFGKQLYEFAGQQFEGAKVESHFGFVALDLRGADIFDGAIVDIDCSFGGMEIRVDKDICVKTAIETSFAGVESQCDSLHNPGSKTLYLKGTCAFGGIEIK